VGEGKDILCQAFAVGDDQTVRRVFVHFNAQPGISSATFFPVFSSGLT